MGYTLDIQLEYEWSLSLSYTWVIHETYQSIQVYRQCIKLCFVIDCYCFGRFQEQVVWQCGPAYLPPPIHQQPEDEDHWQPTPEYD